MSMLPDSKLSEFTELDALRAEIDEERYARQELERELRESRGLLAQGLIDLREAIDNLTAEPGSPHAGAAAAREILAL